MNHRCIWLCSGLALAPPVFAETAGPVAYESAFEGYRSYREQPLADWRGANEDVAAAGGHIGIMRGAAKAATPAGSRPAPANERAPAARGTGEVPAATHRH
jgi:hypothetical protein